MRAYGAEHPNTRAILTESLKGQGRYADAERIQHEVLGLQKRVLGAEHPGPLTTANNLASSLAHQVKYAEAEPMLQAALSAHSDPPTQHAGNRARF